MSSESSQGWRLYNLSGQVLHHSHIKNVFPAVQRGPPVFQFVPIASDLVTRHHWKRLATSWHPSFRYLCTLMRSLLSLLLQAEHSQLYQPFLIGGVLQSLHHLCGPLLDCPGAPWAPFSCTEEPRTGPSTLGEASPVLVREKGSPPSIC